MPLRVEDLFACWWMGNCSQSAIMWKMVPLSYVKACGWNEKIEVSKTKRGLWRGLNPFSFFHSLLGQLLV